MKVMVVPVVIDVLSTITTGLVQRLDNLEIRGQVETLQMTALLRLAGILRKFLATCCHSNSCEKPSANAGVKNSQKY